MSQNQDVINNPPHYTKGKIEPIDFIEANGLDFREGSVVKYITRWKYKNGLEDLKKARFYIDRLIAEESPQEESQKVTTGSSALGELVYDRMSRPLPPKPEVKEKKEDLRFPPGEEFSWLP